MSARGGTEPTEPAERARLDKWLWCARFFKTRGLAAAAANGGKIRVNGARVDKAGYGVKLGDVLTFARGGRGPVVVVEIRAFAERRGPAAEAQALYRVVGDDAEDGAAAQPSSDRPET